MTTRTLLLSLSAAAALAACGGGAPVRPAPMPAPPVAGTECNAANAQFAVGQLATPQLVEEARQRSGSRIVRVIRPGDAVTLDYSTQRLNVEVDAGNRVLRVRCG